jgi:hypothetical protein
LLAGVLDRDEERLMTYALLYNQTDLTNMMAQGQATVARIPAADRNLWNAIWSGGLSSWGVAPDAPAQYQEGDLPVKVVVVNATSQGKPVTKEQFASLLERMAAANPDAGFLLSVASDIRVTAVEPYGG